MSGDPTSTDPSAAIAPDLSPGPGAALVIGKGRAVLMDENGELQVLALDQVEKVASARPLLFCHGRAICRRLKISRLPGFDILELFAFVRPAQNAAPTPRGLARALGLAQPQTLEDEPLALLMAMRELLKRFGADRLREGSQQGVTAWLERLGPTWTWSRLLLAALPSGAPDFSAKGPNARGPNARGPNARGSGIAVWQDLPEWEEGPPLLPLVPVTLKQSDVLNRLRLLRGPEAEARPDQDDYALTSASLFSPNVPSANLPLGATDDPRPHIVLAEGGTGIGKTLGYLAPASLWSQAAKRPIWISTFTRNLQRQIEEETQRLYPEPRERAKAVVLRKGRDNYLCLRNLAEAVAGAAPNLLAPLALVARWTQTTREGDLFAGDFPGWLQDLVGPRLVRQLTDGNRECSFAACPHYRRCFIEKSQRGAKTAQLVIANHALTLLQAVMSGEDDNRLAPFLILDEGHHLFDAADSVFAIEISGDRSHELRRWLVGGERSFAGFGGQGLAARLDGLDLGERGGEALDGLLQAARCLPGAAWPQRIAEGRPQGPIEGFLSALRVQILASSEEQNRYSRETPLEPVHQAVLAAAPGADQALAGLLGQASALAEVLATLRDQEEAPLNLDDRRRVEGSLRALERRLLEPLAAWRDMLARLSGKPDPRFVDWLSLQRHDGREIDVAFCRNWVDPAEPLAKTALARTKGVLITSATLTDQGSTPQSEEIDWGFARARLGLQHLEVEVETRRFPSPFNYQRQAKIILLEGINKNEPEAVGQAMAALFKAAGGGALGLFTAIERLRKTHAVLAPRLAEAGLDLYAQHVDGMDTASLVQIFREETHACLIGTDALRDGVDVPGDSLRLVAFDRIPWPRSSLVLRARLDLFGNAYRDALVRLKLRQAFGRLIRRADDRGVFVLMEPGLPSRMRAAFPPEVEIQRLDLDGACAEITRHLIT